jgi:hypothetical protein
MTEPWLTAVIDQAHAGVAQIRADRPAAHREERCVAPPAGCGQPIGQFREARSYAEYQITGLCQRCQDVVFAPSPEAVAEMAADPEHYGRCHVCGEYREIQHVDVGVGVISGFACCAHARDYDPTSFVRCPRTVGCQLGVDHAHGCDPIGGEPR